VAPFAAKADPHVFPEIYGMSVILLRFVALYSLFDTLNIVFASAIKGAGDTRFVMYTTTIFSVFVLILPTYLAVEVFEYGLMVSWVMATFYVSVIGIIFFMRFRNGAWKSMRVIEPGLSGSQL
jgi:MATE family multidrug resistance protein